MDIREAIPENVKVQKIDMAQFMLSRDLIGDSRLKLNDYRSDGFFIEKLYNENKDDFIFIKDILCYYNHLQSDKMPVSLPRVILMGEDIELKSNKYYDYEDDRMNVRFIGDKEVVKELSEFDPDAILTIGEDPGQFTNLYKQHLDIRSRWIHSTDKNQNNIGEIMYQCSMNYILGGGDKSQPLVSFFTPFFNTGEKLLRTYQSLKEQSYLNWEWVLVNDSNDGGKTLKIAEEIANNDTRVKVYDFREKSGGVIGESKYRAAALSKGKYLMELDHDDILTETAAEMMVKAFKRYPDAKFVYSDCAEIDESHNSLSYGDGFAFGYGKYRTEMYRGKEYKVAVAQNINPKTIRHIVGVPNHFRAWERDFYFSIGGHNRRLTIADDFDLVIRSFLKTKFVGIRKLCYLQFFHNSDSLNNTQDSSRADIQRRVRTISDYYNVKINNRFKELGVEDWAYKENPISPLLSKSRFGNQEGYVNYIYNPGIDDSIPVDIPKLDYLF